MGEPVENAIGQHEGERREEFMRQVLGPQGTVDGVGLR